MRIIDMGREPRQAQFEYFSRLPNPHASVTANCDITHLRQRCKEQGYPFFLSLLYCAVNAANSVPQLRRRLVEGQVVEYETCFSSHTVALEDESYCYCEIDCAKPFGEYLPYAISQVEQAKAAKLLSDQTETARLFFVSSLPWVSFTSLHQPTAGPGDSNPRITFGKYFEQNGRWLIPVDLCVHHALADGIHIARFFEAFDRLQSEF